MSRMQPIQMAQFQIVARPHPYKRGYLFELVMFWTDAHGYQQSKVCGQYLPESHCVVPIKTWLGVAKVYQ